MLNLALQKCCVLHFVLARSGGLFPEYEVNGVVFPAVDSMRDLGVIVSGNLKPSEHCRKISSAAKSVSWLILRAFCTRGAQFMLKMFTVYVRPKVEYITPELSVCSVSIVSAI